MTSLDATKRFSDRVENYVKYRPQYPEEAFTFLKERFHLNTHSTVADIGSGTGISTGPLLKMGCTVYAVEPNAEMRSAAEKGLSKFQNFKSVEGTAEKTNLPNSTLDLVLSAQAFHWFDAKNSHEEFLRILKPEGFVVLMWNIRLETGAPFLEAYEKLLQTFGTDYQKVKNHNVLNNGALSILFGGSHFETTMFPNHQTLDFTGLKGRLLSSSYVPNETDPKCLSMLEELKRVFHQYAVDGQITLSYETSLYFGRLL